MITLLDFDKSLAEFEAAKARYVAFRVLHFHETAEHAASEFERLTMDLAFKRLGQIISASNIVFPPSPVKFPAIKSNTGPKRGRW